MVSFCERLRAERTRLGLNQTDFAALAGVTKKTQMLYEAGERVPDANYLAAIAEAGADLSFIVTGQKNTATPSAAAWAPIDSEKLGRIIEMLEAAAKQAGRRWPAKKLAETATEIYNALGDDQGFDQPRVERILKLVVNR
ncbi:helix-turn-helix domain-containing protein [Pseudomonas sp. NFACC05-1]|uniref:helix-turn-helix domain-containing protein n=1 Tax=Pseudomonas sp. NFACC05-1 TaxID=1566241 RepID=UPI000871A9E6|nr:helix-turn-helix transcriptional regulator [Pseudomonas sp. NFACC05-1]SCW97475.1 Transcriptional regulator, contains XRE-family HTH domain [Pseudomonas sp. NFACC05-1]